MGNPTSYYNGTRWAFTWEHGRNLGAANAGTTSLTFAYDADGTRTSKTVGGVVHTYYYAGGKLLRETYGSNTLDFFYDATGNAYAFKYNGTLYYYITNLQGDVMSIVDGSGNVVASYQYDPYGNPVGTVPAANSIGAVNPLRYRGYYYDSETGFYYLQSRYYDPELGRFLNADTYASTGQGLLGYNMFAYCRNNPVCRIDASGYGDVDFKETNVDDVDVTPDEHELGGGGISGSPNTGSAQPTGSGNFRKALQNLTGDSGEGKDAHHIFSKTFEKPFGKLGIQVHDPKYGSWWESLQHRGLAHEYNQWWEAFFSIDGVTADDAFAVVEFLAGLFGFDLNY